MFVCPQTALNCARFTLVKSYTTGVKNPCLPPCSLDSCMSFLKAAINLHICVNHRKFSSNFDIKLKICRINIAHSLDKKRRKQARKMIGQLDISGAITSRQTVVSYLKHSRSRYKNVYWLTTEFSSTQYPMNGAKGVILI